MKRLPKILLIIGICIGIVLILPWAYTKIVLSIASAEGVYPTAAEGMEDIIKKTYIEPERYHILYAGTNSFDGSDPHVWYVMACVWGEYRVGGSRVGNQRHNYDQPGSFFLNTKDGWVHVSEGTFPQLLGSLMEFFNLAGPGSTQPTHNWVPDPGGECKF